jgi:transposase-like protein
LREFFLSIQEPTIMGQWRKDREVHWRGVLERQAASGLSVADFCRQETVSAPSFYFWRRRLQEQEATGNQQAFRPATVVSSRQLLPVHIESAAPAAAVRILLPQGVSLETSTSIDEGRLSALLRALREASGC